MISARAHRPGLPHRHGHRPTLTLVFPPPFPLTLVGAVDLVHNITTFTGLPDIPLTDLDGHARRRAATALFPTDCHDPTGTATATLTDQNGDKTATVPANFTVAGCPSSSSWRGARSSPGAARRSARPRPRR